MSKTEKSTNSNRSILFRTTEVNTRIKAIESGCLWREPGAKDESDGYFPS